MLTPGWPGSAPAWQAPGVLKQPHSQDVTGAHVIATGTPFLLPAERLCGGLRRDCFQHTHAWLFRAGAADTPKPSQEHAAVTMLCSSDAAGLPVTFMLPGLWQHDQQ